VVERLLPQLVDYRYGEPPLSESVEVLQGVEEPDRRPGSSGERRR
jgi:hypothetical protein